MPWGAVVGAVVSAGAGALASKKAGKRADAAMDSEAAWREAQLELANREFDFNRERYDEWKERFDPVFDSMMGMIDDVEPDYAAIAGDVNMSFDTAREMEERNNRRYGIKPTDGASRQANREYGIKRGLAHVGARSAARAGARDKKYARYSDVFNAGQGIGTSNAAAVSGSMANQQNIMGQNANAANANAMFYNNQASQAASGMGQLVGSIDWGGIWDKVKGWGSTG